MKVNMSWTDKIPAAFGQADKKFAEHPSDSEAAIKLLEAAHEQGVGRDDYLSEIKSWLKSQGCRTDHIKEEIDKVEDIGSYLK